MEKTTTATKLNIYEKIAIIRKEFRALKIKKSGYNKHLDFSYYELGDILKAIDVLFEKYKLFYMFTFDTEKAYITIEDLEATNVDISSIRSSIPFTSGEVAGCGKMQAIGASITYSKRYLLINLLSIEEPDILDATAGEQQDQRKTNTRPAQDQRERTPSATSNYGAIKDLCKEYDVDFDEVKDYVSSTYKKRINDLTNKELKEVKDYITIGEMI